jgi:hypothetical protein
MKETQVELKARVMAQAEARIKEGLAKRAGLKRLSDIEELVDEMTGRLGQALEAEILKNTNQ